MSIKMSNRILFVVVLYNQYLYNTNIYKSLICRLSKSDVFLWDNSSNVTINENIKDDGFFYILSNKNVGISYSYNIAAKYAFEKGFKWITFLDQDTYFPDNYINVLINSIRSNDNINLFCVKHKIKSNLYISPVKRKLLLLTKPSKKCIEGIFSLSKYVIINSGLTVNLELFRKVGGYNEKVFLDYSDFQFIERCSNVISSGFCIDVTCIQSFSNENNDQAKLLKRFELFCLSLKGCKKNNFFNDLKYDILVIKRALSLTIRLKNITPLYIYLKYYIK